MRINRPNPWLRNWIARSTCRLLFGWLVVGVGAPVAHGQQLDDRPVGRTIEKGSEATAALEREDDVESPSIAEQIKRKWVIYRESPQGKYMTIKVHNGLETIVTTYDPNLKVVYSHRSEYTLDDSGPVNIFTYRNKKVLVGRDAGATQEGPVSYLFRIDGERFLEVHGMMKEDTRGPSLNVWQRLKKDPIERPVT